MECRTTTSGLGIQRDEHQRQPVPNSKGERGDPDPIRAISHDWREHSLSFLIIESKYESLTTRQCRHPGRLNYFRVIRSSIIIRSLPLSSIRKWRWRRRRPSSSRCARATVLRPGRSGSRGVAHRTMFLPSKAPSLWRIDIVVCRESYHTVVKRFVFGSKPEIPVPVLWVPSELKKVKSDCRNLPSCTMYCLHVAFVTMGFPFIGKNVFTTSHSPTNCASSF